VIVIESSTSAPAPPRRRDAARRRAATVDRALRCAEAVARDVTQGPTDAPALGLHVRRLRRLARRCEADGLPRLAEVAGLAAEALKVPRPQHGLVDQAVGLLTLASRDAERGGTPRAALEPVIAAMRDHLRYAGARE
jgi:hypothetical protein